MEGKADPKDLRPVLPTRLLLFQEAGTRSSSVIELQVGKSISLGNGNSVLTLRKRFYFLAAGSILEDTLFPMPGTMMPL